MRMIKQMIIPISKARSGIKRTGLVGITIHNTGNYSQGAGAFNHAKYLAGGGKNHQVSWHFAVDDMRLAGQSYGAIAKVLALSENTVKSYCRRNDLQACNIAPILTSTASKGGAKCQQNNFTVKKAMSQHFLLQRHC